MWGENVHARSWDPVLLDEDTSSSKRKNAVTASRFNRGAVMKENILDNGLGPLQKQYDQQREALNKSNLEIIGYQMGLESLEARIVVHEKNEAVYKKIIAFFKINVTSERHSIKDLKNQSADRKTTTSVPETETSISKTSKDVVEKPKTVRPSAQKLALNNKGMVTGQREIRQVWNNAQRVNNQNKLTHPHPKRNFVPTAVATKSGQVPVNTAKVNNVTTAGPKAVVSAAVGNGENAIKSSACWI
ncbi:hypothetical protein Tco_0525467 [Tanacetum coccineum]